MKSFSMHACSVVSMILWITIYECMGLPLFCSVSTLQGTFYCPHNVIQTENNLNVIVVLPKIIHPQKYTHFRIKSGVFFQFGFEKVSVYLFYLCMNKQQTKPALCISRLQQSTINQSIEFLCHLYLQPARKGLWDTIGENIKLHVWKGKM